DAVAKLAHQRLGGVRKRLEAGQPEKAASSLYGVNKAKDIVENLGVVGVLLETDQFHVDEVETFIRFGQEFAQQVVHGPDPSANKERRMRRAAPPSTHVQFVAKQFKIGCLGGRKTRGPARQRASLGDCTARRRGPRCRCGQLAVTTIRSPSVASVTASWQL